MGDLFTPVCLTFLSFVFSLPDTLVVPSVSGSCNLLSPDYLQTRYWLQDGSNLVVRSSDLPSRGSCSLSTAFSLLLLLRKADTNKTPCPIANTPLSKAGNPTKSYQYIRLSRASTGHDHVPHPKLAFSIGTRQIHVKATAEKTTACTANPQILRALPGGIDNSELLAILISRICEKTPYTTNTVTNGFSRHMERKNIPEARGSP